MDDARHLVKIPYALGRTTVEYVYTMWSMYIPKNTTSLIQPADAGIIKCFKGYYRNLTVQKCLYMVEGKKAMGLTVLGSDMAKKITVLDAIHMAVEAWGKVKQSTIQNCFKKCLQDQSVQVDPMNF